MSELPDYNKIQFPINPPVPLEEILPDASAIALDLLSGFLVYPSNKRLPAKTVSTTMYQIIHVTVRIALYE